MGEGCGDRLTLVAVAFAVFVGFCSLVYALYLAPEWAEGLEAEARGCRNHIGNSEKHLGPWADLTKPLPADMDEGRRRQLDRDRALLRSSRERLRFAEDAAAATRRWRLPALVVGVLVIGALAAKPLTRYLQTPRHRD